MSRKSTALALAAAASLGALALSASHALAFHPSGGGVRVAGPAHVATGGLHVGPVLHAPAFKIVKLPPPIVHPPIVHPPHHWHWHWAWRHRYWIPPVVVGGAVGATYAVTTPAAASSTCTCLTKQYTPEGAVVFKDVCTNEMAMNPPVGATTGDASPPQGYVQPQQQGYLQSQTRAQ